MIAFSVFCFILFVTVGVRVSLVASQDDSQTNEIKLGALLEKDESLKKAFEAAVRDINNENYVEGTTFVPVTLSEIPNNDIFGAQTATCSLMADGIAGIFGPWTNEISDHVQSLCDTMEVPHITARWDTKQRRSSCQVNLYPHPSVLAQAAVDLVTTWNWKGFTILYDRLSTLSKVGLLVQLANDRGYVVTANRLAGTPDDKSNFRPILQRVKFSGETNIVIECSDDLLFEVLKQAQQTGIVGSDYNYIVTSLNLESIDLDPFKWAGTNVTGLRMFDPKDPKIARVVNSWDPAENDEESDGGEESEGGADDDEGNGAEEDEEGERNKDGDENDEQRDQEQERKRRQARRRDYKREDNQYDENEEENGDAAPDTDANGEEEEEEEEEADHDGNTEGETGEEEGKNEGEEEGKGTDVEDENTSTEIELKRIPRVEEILLYDAVRLFTRAISNLNLIETKPLKCGEQQSWESGYSIINFMKMSELDGLSGKVKFNNEGFRTEIDLEVVALTEEGLVKIGTWSNSASGSSGLSLAITETDEGPVVEGEDMKNVTFIVLIALTYPYGMLKEDSKQLMGNDRFEGFGIDLIHELSLMSNFNYTFRVQEDKSSGNPSTINGTRVWNGMIGEVLKGNADLAIADISITRERQKDAEFTMPFMNLGISILFKKPRPAPPSLFSFLSPFSKEVWAYMMSAYVGVSLLLFCMARISPKEWTNPYPCIEEPAELENQFSLLNSLWFTMGALMQQGTELAPISVSTRMLAAIWWFFTLIMVSSYTANLAAFLTVENTVEPFKDVRELAAHPSIKYGAKANGTTAFFFRDSTDPTYQKMWKFMKSNPDVMMPSNEAGVKRVTDNDDYAFLMESTSIEYEIERNCEITQVGGLLDSKGYGIVMRHDSWYRHILGKNVVKLQENGKLIQLKDKWWKEKRGGGACSNEEEGDGASELDLTNVGGVFVVLLCGSFLAIFLAIFELLWDIYQRDDKESFKKELIEEVKFISKCHGTVKPVQKRKSGSGSSPPSPSLSRSRRSKNRRTTSSGSHPTSNENTFKSSDTLE